MIETAKFLFFILFVIYVHEFGHYLVAKREGNYKGWSIFPTPHIKLTKPFSSRWGYLSGLLTSFLTLPVGLIIYQIDFQYLTLFTLLYFGLAILDIIIFIFYGRIDLNETN